LANKTDTRFYVHNEGNVGGQPVARTWDDIVAMCQSGQLRPDSMVFFEVENVWKKAGETELAVHFGASASAETDVADQDELRGQYEILRREADDSRFDWNRSAQLGEMAAALGDHEAAFKHFQAALERHRYHTMLGSRAKRCLSSEDCQRLSFLSRPDPVWNDLVGLVSYPFSRGPLYLAIPTVVMAALFWLPGVALVGFLLLYLWATEIIRTAAQGDAKPPLWHGLVSTPVDTVLKPLGTALIVAIQVYAPFIIVAMVLGVLTNEGLGEVIQGSPIMIVLMSTVTLLYVPAVLVIAGGTDGDVRRIANPKSVISVVLKMETEYVISVGIILALVSVWGLLSYLFTMIPFAGHVAAVAVGVYALIAGGLVVGRLQSRFAEEFK